jgi:hypothetical protein
VCVVEMFSRKEVQMKREDSNKYVLFMKREHRSRKKKRGSILSEDKKRKREG